MSERVEYVLEAGLARITMNDGRANALSLDMQAELNAALERAAEDNAAILLTGRDGMFSAGFDLKTMQAGGADAGNMVIGGFELTRRLLAHPRPVVTASNGHAMAMGLFLLLSGDYVMGVGGDFKIAANEVAIGLTMPHCPIEICRERLTPAFLHRMLGSSEFLTPETALPGGVMDELCAADALQGRATEKLAALAELPADTFANTKARLRADLLERLDAALVADRKEMDRLFGS